jgi:hypothetical protein
VLAAALLLAHAWQAPQIQIDDPADESLRVEVQTYVADGSNKVERFFGSAFPSSFKVEVVPSRAAFDKIFKERWGVDHTEPWAVAAGVSDSLYLLSPRVWKTQAAEHDPSDKGHVRRIITPELTHVYHGQINPSKDFDGMDDLAWLIEGVATYVSGQLDSEHKGDDVEAIKKGQAPKSLATAWSGRYRYAVSGSLVRYVDRHYGRPKLMEILKLTKPEDVLRALGVTENQLLQDWETSAQHRSGA